MATGTLATTARKYHEDLTHYVVAPIVYTVLTGTIGKIPAGAAVIEAGIVVTTAFAGGTPQTLDMGTAADPDGFATALALTSKGRVLADELATSDDLYQTTDTDVTYTLSAGATPSAGAGYVFVRYIMANRSAG
ncbi:hypothetical protein [Paradevosia shaoguanensis]|uniref:hypothetical protein n=1 Tax=Paradevosia shaoguanensis TaxID=1335043 RepID=UPI0019340B99|nr:hypothetical protein [Paradevosia shaoguanensis]